MNIAVTDSCGATRTFTLLFRWNYVDFFYHQGLFNS
jgi:hypothetical protein